MLLALLFWNLLLALAASALFQRATADEMPALRLRRYAVTAAALLVGAGAGVLSRCVLNWRGTADEICLSFLPLMVTVPCTVWVLLGVTVECLSAREAAGTR
ncbi:hypothetical protein GCM10028796_13720 [Ramlibacter monticola]|uniref:Uncharacterized protein n=1 Tax=Ramlibacter monticola TaxID=1926872 RepID=A0A936YWF2_9BURK|nr:hypothetical protein [Ramlibacter monticola]MBL0390208.1 hypothetical protein [Ramlibacter monticola]